MAESKPSSLYIPAERRSVISALVTGLGVGIVGWLLSMAIQLLIIEPVFCRSPQSFGVCSNGGTIGWTVAMIITGIIGLLSLVRTGVFRPLLVVLAALIALWGASAWLGPMLWWQSMLWHGLLFALAYGLFAWVARLRAFIFALILTIVLIILARVLVISS